MTQPKNETQILKLTTELRTVQEHNKRKFKNQQEQTRTEELFFFLTLKPRLTSHKIQEFKGKKFKNQDENNKP